MNLDINYGIIIVRSSLEIGIPHLMKLGCTIINGIEIQEFSLIDLEESSKYFEIDGEYV